MDDFIAGMPKTELHLHLEGTLEPELLRRLAARNGVEVPIPDGAFTDLTSFLAQYYPAMQALVTEQDFYELAFAYLEKAHSQNIVHAELFFDPQAHTSRGVAFDAVIMGYQRAIDDASARFGIDAALIMCILRDHSVESADETLSAALPYRDRIVGVGLDSDERGNPPAKFAAVFARARAEGFKLTMHCDVDQVGSIENIRQVLDDIGVDRIDHGTNILEDPRLVDLVRERGIGLTSCPLSNGIVSEGMKAAEIVELLRGGVRVTINSDDPAYFGGYLTENLQALARAADLTRDELVQLQRNALNISWIGDEKRAALLERLESYSGTSSLSEES
jgi:adenosine deaminase